MGALFDTFKPSLAVNRWFLTNDGADDACVPKKFYVNAGTQ